MTYRAGDVGRQVELELQVTELRNLVLELLPYAKKTEDEGPYHEGWHSKKLMDLIRRANTALDCRSLWSE